jgi:syntaxin 5
MIDRTKEFLRLTSEVEVVPLPHVNNGKAGGGSNNNGPIIPSTLTNSTTGTTTTIDQRREKTRQAIFFNEKAAEVSKGIQACSVLLARLTTLARAQTLFNDPQDEMSTLSIKVKNEISQLKTRLSDLEEWLKKNDLGTGKDAKLHSEQIVKTMEFKLQDSGKQFVRVLESRKIALRAQTQRKRMFGDDDDHDDIGRPMPQSAFAVAVQQDEEASYQTSRSEAYGGNMGNGSERPVTSASMVPFQQQRQLIPDTQYLITRVNAISTVESHIAELGQVMSTLATMIHEQDSLVNDIHNNVEGSAINMRQGFEQLEKYYHSIRGNKRLLSRLFGVVVVFLLFFLFFLA